MVGKEYLATKTKMKKHKLTGEGGKGSTPRINTHSKQYQDNWDIIFANKDIKVNDVKSTHIGSEETQQETKKKK